ncbi:tRNA (adenine(22)-N(1))-methyltransferase [Lysinibacillus piscis]|uniref:SAM-dependent methyltransferase n=1 Tax=Lysinibacillus piscis TaxID=2518931 RepID=A0ABQ5NJQ1_9BACI|nr:tRNA (adenine(22)-N(1))-methyltransferase TrmK [Lysinibacillus sp. KH24]GLC88588.1 SAM-dependent methyltransferase [Lysinibacillus sp. KH24]
MNAQKLSQRLQTVATFVPTGAIVADIGSDHAYLPCYLVQADIATAAIAGEVVKGPFESAVRQVQKEGLSEKITVRLADGLAAIKLEDHVDTITIAGMGGPLIASILEKHPEKLQTVTRLILQPNIHAKAIREWALSHQWAILDEEIIEEDDKIYEILVLQKGTMQLDEIELLCGPKLIQRKAPAFVKKWQREQENWQRILQSIEGAEQTTDIETKRQELARQLHLVEGVL